MSQEIIVANPTVALALPEEKQFMDDMKAINRFQQIVHQNLVKDLDYGVIPGTGKPTLLKPGAEKIAKLLRLSDTYAILDRSEDWKQGFFRYIVKCTLTHIDTGTVISEGLGECNSMETKYRYRFLPKDPGPGANAVKVWKKGKGGKQYPTWRTDNDEIYSQVNTLIKMAKKRALVDASLSAGRLSNVFTQDVEDIPSIADNDSTESNDDFEIIDSTSAEPQPETTTYDEPAELICPIHNAPFVLKDGQYGQYYSHQCPKSKDFPKGWCNLPIAKAKELIAQQKTPQNKRETASNDKPALSREDEAFVNQIKEFTQELGMNTAGLKDILSTYNGADGHLLNLTDAQRNALMKELSDMVANK
ncbi:MAG: hypothetical protein WC372_10270 [Candidatus Neomarinimicrobiota bacterium]|jgi:hypothetical protein